MRLAALCIVVLAGCATPPPPLPSFAVSFFTEADPGVPLAGVKVMVNGEETGISGPTGLVQTFVRGPVGTKVDVSFECPPAYRPPSDSISLRLRQIDNSGDEDPRGLELRLNCRPEKRFAVFVVNAENGAGFPLSLDGKTVSRTDKNGIAHASTEAEPGTLVQLKFDSRSNPVVKPQNPVQQFTLPDEDTLFFVTQEFKLPRKPRRRRGPRRIRRIN